MPRTVAWFSCGAASAVAAKLMLEENPKTVVARCIVKNEHPDNDRFAHDCARWFDTSIIELRSERYSDCWQVWQERRFLNSPKGALCTTEMKKMVRQGFQLPDDIQIFGFTMDEQHRADLFRQTNPEIDVRFPLIEQHLTKADCFERVRAAGIKLPMMYRLGYHNANCVGCVKGGKGYWNKIRRDFPEVFARMAALEEEIGATCLKEQVKVGGKKVTVRVPLRKLDPKAGRHEDLDLPECGVACGLNEGERDDSAPTMLAAPALVDGEARLAQLEDVAAQLVVEGDVRGAGRVGAPDARSLCAVTRGGLRPADAADALPTGLPRDVPATALGAADEDGEALHLARAPHAGTSNASVDREIAVVDGVWDPDADPTPEPFGGVEL